MHKAKGLEADYVIVVGMNSGKFGFPSEREDDPILRLVMPKKEEFEYAEERRLFYVALTRAKQKVYLLVPTRNPPRFVKEIVRDDYSDAIMDEITDEDGKTTSVRICPKCSGFLLKREGPYSIFYGCSNWQSADSPCDYTEKEKCPKCEIGTLKAINGKWGIFYGCSAYKKTGCDYTQKPSQRISPPITQARVG